MTSTSTTRKKWSALKLKPLSQQRDVRLTTFSGTDFIVS